MSEYAIRFGLGAIKAVGVGAMEKVSDERKENGDFKDVYDLAKRINPKLINKKSIEALAKSGSFDSLETGETNRRQIAESFEILSAYSNQQSEEANSNQMMLFSGVPEANVRPPLKKIEDWNSEDRLQKEFEAFGFFLNNHPVDAIIGDLRKRGTVFSDKLESGELADGNLIKMAGVIATSKHRSSARGRFAYITLSDPFGIFEAMIFDEALITNSRDILEDGSSVMLECLIRKDEGGIRVLVQNMQKMSDFIKNTEASKEEFEDIKQKKMRSYRGGGGGNSNYSNKPKAPTEPPKPSKPITQPKKIPAEIEIKIAKREQILMLKSLLSQRVAPDSEQDTTSVYFITDGKRILLPQKFLLNEIDLLRIGNITQ